MKSRSIKAVCLTAALLLALSAAACKKENSNVDNTSVTSIEVENGEKAETTPTGESETPQSGAADSVSASSEIVTEDDGKTESEKKGNLQVGVPEGQDAVTDPEITVIENDGDLEFIVSDSLAFGGE